MRASAAVALLCASILAGRADATHSSAIALAERNYPAEYFIVVPEGASAVNRTAAHELVLWTEKLTGVKLPVQTDAKPLPPKAVLIGSTRYNTQLGVLPDEPFPASAFRLAVRGPHLVVTAGKDDDTALVYGACEIVQRFGGLEWFTDEVADVPQLDKLEVPADYDRLHAPSFAVRDPGWGAFKSPAWAARFRVNGTHVGHSKFYGWSPLRWHDSFKHCHSFRAIASKEEFGETHPEYFQHGTNGLPNIRHEKAPQLCLTNPGVWAIAKERFLAAVRESPNIKYFGVSQQDNTRWCRCAKCMELIDREGGADSATLVPFLNMLADELQKVRPDAYLTTLAYHQTRNPPKTLELRKNVLVGLCVTECDFTRPIVGNPHPGNQSFLAALEKWARISGGVWIWDYCTNYYWFPHTMPDVHALAGNIRLYADNKVFYVYESATTCPYAFFGDLKAYVCAKLMWDAHQPLDPLVDRFLKAFYGPAAGKAREVFDLFENFERDIANVRMSYSEDACSTNWPDALFERAAILWKEAESLAAGQAPYADRAHRARFGNDTTRLVRYVCRLADDPAHGLADVPRRNEMASVAAELLALDARLAAERAAKPDEKLWNWGWSWTARRKFKEKVEAFVRGDAIPGGKDCQSRGRPLVLAQRGKAATYRIVVPEGASAVNRTAADELALWTEKLTGVKLPVQTDAKPLPPKAVLIGSTRYNTQLGALPDEPFPASAFRLAVRGPHLVVTAGKDDDTALVYGACEIVQRFGGLEWFTDEVADVPQLNRLDVPAGYDRVHVPSIPIRDPGFGMFVSPAWAARFRVNGTHVGHSRSYGWSPIRWHGKFKHCHSFNAIASKAEFAKTHPEYFQKHPSGKPNLWDKYPQLCLTNPDVWALAKERFMAAVRESQDVKYFGVSQSDNVRWCRCQACRELIDREGGADSATLVPFLNMLADELAKERPDAYLTTLAYHQTRNPPKTLELRKNVLVGLCVTECDFTRPIVGNPYPGNKSFLAALEKWARISGGVWIWDYAADFFFLPHAMPDVHALAGNIRLYADKNVFYVYECVTHGVQNPYAFFWELKAYVCAKLMWNAYQPLDPLVERFMVACYGPAAGKVREIYDLFENFERDREHSFMGYQENMCSTNFPDVLFERAAALWKEAEALAASQAPFADMVHRGRLGNDMTRVARHVCRLAEDSGFGRDDPARAAEMLAAAKEIAAVEAKRCADKEANPAAPSWDWGYTWTSRLRLKEKVEAFVEGRPIPGAPSPKKTAGEKTKLKKGGTAK